MVVEVVGSFWKAAFWEGRGAAERLVGGGGDGSARGRW